MSSSRAPNPSGEKPPFDEQKPVDLKSVLKAFQDTVVATESWIDVQGALSVKNQLNVGGDIVVRGDISLINRDCAEEFDITPRQGIEPGTVMVLSENGKLEPSSKAYDKKVAGVVSGAGDYKPGLILGKQQQWQSEEDMMRLPIALMGTVYCKVDASVSIEIGDLLTTSPTKGHAMKADDPIKAFGTVIGKALRSIKEGKGLIPVLVALQ